MFYYDQFEYHSTIMRGDTCVEMATGAPTAILNGLIILTHP